MNQENGPEFKQKDEMADLNILSRRIVSLYHAQRYVEMEAAARQLQVALPQHSAGYEYLALAVKLQ